MKKGETISISFHEASTLILKPVKDITERYVHDLTHEQKYKNPKREIFTTQISSVKKRIYHYQVYSG